MEPVGGPDPSTPSAAEKARILAAIAAIGDQGDSDYILDPAKHALCLGSEAEALRWLLLNDPFVQSTAAKYEKHDRAALRHQRRYVFQVYVVMLGAIVVVGLAMLLATTSLAPTPLFRTLLSGAAALIIASLVWRFCAFVTLARRLPARLKPHHELLLSCLIASVAGLAAWCIWLILPGEVTPSLRLWLSSAVGVLLIVAVVGFEALGRSRSWKRWQERRGKAEAFRKHHFEAVLSAKLPAAKLPDPVPVDMAPSSSHLHAHKFEYFRRYQLQVQSNYYAEKGKQKQADAKKSDLWRLVPIVFLVVVLLLLLFSALGSRSEQHAAPGVLQKLFSVMHSIERNGLDDAAILIALVAGGSYALRFMDAVLADARRLAYRYQIASKNIYRVVGSEGQSLALPEFDRPTPLLAARIASVRNDAGTVDILVRAVHHEMSTEHSAWVNMSRYQITGTAPGEAARLTSAVRLTPQDFDMIALELRTPVFKARKVGFAAARQATVETAVTTHWNGKESHDVAAAGDWIATNMSKDMKILRDKAGNANTYVIRKARFFELYFAEPGGSDADFGTVYRSKSTVEAFALPGGFDIVAPWGENQRGASGYLLANGDDIYGNSTETFDQTYDVVHAAP